MTDDRSDLLIELEEPQQVKPQAFYVSLFIFSIYMLIVILLQFVNLTNFSFAVRKTNWLLVFEMLTLPFIGLILFVFRKKAGWIICLFYYLCMEGIVSVTIYRDSVSLYFSRMLVPGIVLWILILISLLLLFSTSIRQYFRINRKALLITSAVSVVLIGWALIFSR